MIVKCTKTFNFDGTLSTDGGFWVHIDKEYQVFALRHIVNSSDVQRLECLIVGEDHYGLTMQNMEQFEIVSDYIPSNWGVCRDHLGWVCIMPKNWFPLAKPEYLWEMVEYFSWNPKYEYDESDNWFLDEANKIISEEKEYLAKIAKDTQKNV